MKANEVTWHIPFESRQPSVAFHQNFLMQFENVYVMDNHRAAYWCWAQQCDLRSAINVLHVDRHYDTVPRPSTWLDKVPDVALMSIADYLSIEAPVAAGTKPFPLFSWDNYLSFFLLRHSDVVNQFWCATHRDGTAPEHKPTQIIEPWQLPGDVQYLREADDAPWICNIDLDYFFFGKDQKVVDRLTSDSYLESFFATVQELRAYGTISVVTLCLSPECSNGWSSAEAIAEQACEILGVPFGLPV